MRRSIGIKALSLSLVLVLMGISSINSFAYSDDYSIEVIDESTETVSDLSEDLIESDDVDSDVFEENTEVIEDDYLSDEGADLELLSDYADTVDTEGDDELVYVSEPIEVPGPGYGSDDSDILLDEYINKLVNEKTGAYEGIDQADSELLSSSDTLNGVLYDFLNGNIVKVAAGELASTEFTKDGIDLTPFYDGKEGFSKEDLGVSDLYSGEAFNRVLEKLGFDYSEVIFSLITTLPYDLYWFDKVSGSQYSTSFTYNISNDLLKVNSISLTIDMYVAPDFSADGTAKTTDIDIEKTGAAKNTVATAEKVVADAITSGCVSDYEKLKYYKTYICDAVSYNKTAASSNTAYGNPWQLIYVFDGDASTKVVCEGYSKAFKLLCDLSDFASDKIMCQLMTGTLEVTNQSPGGHMWNVVHMDDGLNYLVDVTNCDTEVQGYEIVDERLFLVGYSTCDDTGESWFVIQRPRLDVSGGYIAGDAVGYAYDSQTSKYYSSSQKKIAAENYDLNSEIPVVTSYTVSFDANGGTLSGADSSISVENGEKYGSLPTPVREGYVFAGWYTAAEDGSLITADSYVSETANHTLYAHWTVKELTVTFNPGIGSLDETDNSKKVNYAAKYGTLPVPARDGYTFAGWYTAAEGGSVITADSTVTRTADHTLYAHWTVKELTVTFDPGIGSLDETDNSKKVNYAAKYGTLPVPVRDGYTFSGWYTAAEGGSLITADSAVTNTADHTLYAHWEGKELTITLNPGEGNLEAGSSTKKVRVNGNYGSLPIPSREGYNFAGWYTAAEGGSLITADSAVTNTADHAMYARWTAKELTITFNPGAGNLDENSTSKKVNYNSKYGTLPSPVRDGYTFAGWYTELQGGSIVTAESTVTGTTDFTLYAHWTAKELTVTFNAGAGSLDANNKSKKVNYNSKYGTLPVPVRDGYTFSGWYTAAEGGSLITADSAVTNTADHTLYAHWEGKELTITLNPGEGNLEAGSSTKKVRVNGNYGSLPIPSREGYNFAGWYTAAEGGSLITADSAVTNTADHTLYAYWTARELTVTFNPGDGSLDAGSKSKKVNYNAKYGTLPVPVLDGYTFAGWFTAAEGGSVVSADDTVTNSDDHTLYAHWTKNQGEDAPGEGSNTPGESGDIGGSGNEGDDENDDFIIPDGLWASGIQDEYEYTGSPITPQIKVYYGSILLRKGAEYTVSYKNNKNAGTATITISGKGNFSGKCTAEFAITPLEIADGDVDIAEGLYNKGKEVKPVVTVIHDGVTLKAGRDYKLEYAPITTVGEREIKVIGTGNYTGEAVGKFIVRDAETPLLKSSVIAGLKKNYTLDEIKALEEDSSQLIVTLNKKQLDSEDYTFKFENCNRIGKGTIVILPSGNGHYAGEKRVSVTIVGKKLGSIVLTNATCMYNGEEAAPEVKVYTGSKGTGEQVPENAYEFSFNNDPVNAGTYTITAVADTAKGYSGKTSAKLKITPRPITDEGITVTLPETVAYTKGAVRPSPVVTYTNGASTLSLREGIDYTISYANNKQVGAVKAPTFTIAGKGNFSGKRAPQEFTVVKKDISELAVSCADIAANPKKKGAYYCSKPVIYDVNGTALKENTDYRVRYIRLDTEEEIARTDVLPEGTRIRAEITACERNYTGSKQATYLITSEVKNISKAKAAKIQNQNYTGKAIEPDALDLTLDKHLVEGQDYVITSYYNNVNKGTASVRIEGIGSYSGCKILKFKIVAANNNRIWKGKFNR